MHRHSLWDEEYFNTGTFKFYSVFSFKQYFYCFRSSNRVYNSNYHFCFSLGIVPHRHPITVVTGAPLKVRKIDNPTREQIGELHEKYVEAVKNLYEEYNPIYGDINIPLVIT